MNVRRWFTLVAIVCIPPPMLHCSAIGVGLLYSKADLPESRIVRNVHYSEAPDSDPVLNRLDLFLPDGAEPEGWPTLVFVHGGSWNEGDKDLRVAGADVYGNIGRFFASHGIGAAIISYRLLPHVDWKTQVADVASATAWVHKHIRKYRGDPNAIFLAGHSAGAQIASRVALDPAFLNALGLSPRILCGVIPISGIGYNFLNPETYQFGKDEGAIEANFHKEDLSRRQRKEMSPIFYVKESSPPFLILYAAHDPEEIRHASQRLGHALVAVGARTQMVSIPREGHASMVLALSHADRMPATAMMVFMRASSCDEARK